MGADRPSGTGAGTSGGSVAVSLAADDADQGRRPFEGLAAGGGVTMPYERQYWRDEFGVCTDSPASTGW